jgi:hypothetical protein
MNPVTYIRQKVFGCETQEAFADILGTTQASVSRWERDERIPGHRQSLVRDKARERGLDWRDEYFFEVPAAA